MWYKYKSQRKMLNLHDKKKFQNRFLYVIKKNTVKI